MQAYILGTSESCFIKFVLPRPPSLILLQRKIAESRNKDLYGRHKGEMKKVGKGEGRKAWTWVLGKNCHPKTE